MANNQLASFTDILDDEICNSQPFSLPSSNASSPQKDKIAEKTYKCRPPKGTGQHGQFRSVEEIDAKYRGVFTYPFFNLVQSSVIEDAVYSDKSMVVCAPTGSGKTVVFEMAIVQLLMELEDKHCNEDFKIIYMAPVKALCTEKLTEWYPKFTKLGVLCIEVTGDTDVDFPQLKPYKLIITTPEKWDILTRRWRDHKGLVEVIKLFLIDEVHILNDEVRGPVLEAVVSRMKTIESSAQSAHRIEQLQHELQGAEMSKRTSRPRIRFVAVSATVSNPEEVATWLSTPDKPAVFYKFGDECRPVKLKRIVEGYPCPDGTSIFKFDITLNYRLWPIIQKYHDGKPTLIFCNTRKSVALTAETLSRELTICFNPEQKAKLTALASTIKNKKLQCLVMSGVGCHHAGLLYEERLNIERAFRNRDLPILITTTTLAMGVNLPAHLVIVKNTQQYVNGAYQEYSISTVLQMVGRAGRPQYDTEATAVIMTRLADKPRYQALVGGSEPLQSYLHKRLAENLNSEAALGTVGDVAQCVQWLRSTFLFVRAAKDPRRYLGLPQNSPQHLISKKIEELCVKAMNGLASSGLITMDEASCIESTEAGRLMSIYYLDLETMRHIMKLEGTETLERLVWLICESHELADMHLRTDERRCLNALNRNSAAPTIRFPMKGKITTRQMKLNCVIQSVLGCLPIPDPSLGQEAMKIMRIADRVCKCLVAYVTRPDLISHQKQFYSAVLNSLTLAKCVASNLWENSPYVSKQLKGIGPTFSTLLATAGKVNFLLLEESHPRDLERGLTPPPQNHTTMTPIIQDLQWHSFNTPENNSGESQGIVIGKVIRDFFNQHPKKEEIMNKGPPAGNVLRKQISLLPKYQLTISPVDEKTVTLQLTMLNLSYLAENIEALTAGDNHKSYIVVGDSSNHLLLLTSFKDKDLISVYDGIIKYTIKRKHDFEHKLFAHCISSSFVSIDVYAEYPFNDLEYLLPRPNAITNNDIPPKKINKQQTCITDTFRERKRKNINEIDITLSKEKKKRETALIERFKSLKESFNFTTKGIKEPANTHILAAQDKNGSASNAEVSKHSVLNEADKCTVSINPDPGCDTKISVHEFNVDEIDSNDDIDNEQVNSILNEIENEISKVRSHAETSVEQTRTSDSYPRKALQCPVNANSSANISKSSAMNTGIVKLNDYKNIYTKKKSKPVLSKPNNYKFIELLERKLEISDDEGNILDTEKNNGFSDAIKCHIEKYLLKAQNKTNVTDKNMEKLLEDTESVTENLKYQVNSSDQSTQGGDLLDGLPEPIYKIKEILQPMDNIKEMYEFTHDQIKRYTEEFSNTQDENVNNSSSNNCIIQDSNHKVDTLVPYYKSSNLPNENNISSNLIVSNTTSSDSTIERNNIVKHNSEVCFNNCSSTNFIIQESNRKIDALVPYYNGSNFPNENNISSNKIVSNTTFSDSKIERNNNVKDNSEVCLDSEITNHSYGLMAILSKNELMNIEANGNETHSSAVPLDNIYSRQDNSHSLRLKNVCDENKVNKFPDGNNCNDQNDEHVYNYSFSAIKVDSTIKDSVKVVRKLKVDVKVSEIISRERTNIQSNTYNSEGNLERPKNKSVETLTPYQNVLGGKIERNLSVLPICKHIAAMKDNFSIDKLPERKLCPLIYENKNIPEQTSQEKVVLVKDVNIAHSEVNPNDERPYNIREQDNSEPNYIEPNKHTFSKTKESELKNIFQKYSKILGNEPRKPASPVRLNTNAFSNINNNKSSETKPKRPFKISEIHNLRTTLPNTLIPDLHTSINDSLPKIEEIVDKQQTQLEEFILQHHEPPIAVENKIDCPEYQYSNDFETLVSPDFEPDKDYKIDHSMFDPQTLLQCVGKTPLQLCDEINYSPDYDGDIAKETNYNKLCTISPDTRHDVHDFNESIFEDNTCATELTPSKEIETWTLSCEDSWNEPESTAIKSFTVMRKNTPDDIDDSVVNSALPRRVRLGKFKFNHKDKFKVRR